MNIQTELMQGVVHDVVLMLMQAYGIDWPQALNMFCQSETFHKLCDPNTGLYRESPACAYDFFCNEMKFGKIIQREF